MYVTRRRSASVRIERKSGNVADFCRRFGRAYRYMIMLDADSVMSGATLVRLTELMEANPGVGMIQTAPVAVNQHSLFARAQQFSSRLYGRIFAAGLHYWPLSPIQFGLMLIGPLYGVINYAILLGEDLPARRAALLPAIATSLCWGLAILIR